MNSIHNVITNILAVYCYILIKMIVMNRMMHTSEYNPGHTKLLHIVDIITPCHPAEGEI